MNVKLLKRFPSVPFQISTFCRAYGRVKLVDEADEFCVSMTEFDRLSERIEWIDLSFVERKRTPEWAIHIGRYFAHARPL